MREPYQIVAEFPDELVTLLQEYEAEKNAQNEQLKRELQELSQTENAEQQQLESWHAGALREINDRAQREKRQLDSTANEKMAEAERRRKKSSDQALDMENTLVQKGIPRFAVANSSEVFTLRPARIPITRMAAM